MYDKTHHKRIVKEELSRRGLGSYMNETKWRKLLTEIYKLPFPPPYQRKDVLHAEPEPSRFDSDVTYWGDYEEGLFPCFSIEWIRIRPRYLVQVAQWLPKQIVDCQRELEAALSVIGQAFEKTGDSIWIYGYR